MAEFLAPPPYDDRGPPPELPGFIATIDSYQPSAPPPTTQFETPYGQMDDMASTPLIGEESVRVFGQQQQVEELTKMDRAINSYVSYSIVRHLRKYIEPKREQQDPELDVEAQFGRQAVRSAQMAIEKKRRLQCISGWLWCAGVVLIPLYIALPVAMIVVGIVGIGECPFRSDTVIIYLIGGGIVLSLLVLLRCLPSVLTCMRTRNCCMSSQSHISARVVCSFEVLFYIFMFVNFIALILGTYTTFAEGRPDSCMSTPTQNCCDTFVYVSSATFTVLQFVLYTFTSLFVCLVLCCFRCVQSKVST